MLTVVRHFQVTFQESPFSCSQTGDADSSLHSHGRLSLTVLSLRPVRARWHSERKYTPTKQHRCAPCFALFSRVQVSLLTDDDLLVPQATQRVPRFAAAAQRRLASLEDSESESENDGENEPPVPSRDDASGRRSSTEQPQLQQPPPQHRLGAPSSQAKEPEPPSVDVPPQATADRRRPRAMSAKPATGGIDGAAKSVMRPTTGATMGKSAVAAARGSREDAPRRGRSASTANAPSRQGSALGSRGSSRQSMGSRGSTDAAPSSSASDGSAAAAARLRRSSTGPPMYRPLSEELTAALRSGGAGGARGPSFGSTARAVVTGSHPFR